MPLALRCKPTSVWVGEGGGEHLNCSMFRRFYMYRCPFVVSLRQYGLKGGGGLEGRNLLNVKFHT